MTMKYICFYAYPSDFSGYEISVFDTKEEAENFVNGKAGDGYDIKVIYGTLLDLVEEKVVTKYSIHEPKTGIFD